jgi:hypothetical protein
MSVQSNARPMGVTILVAVAVIGALFNFVVAADLLGIGGAIPAADRGSLAVPVGVIMLLSAVLLLLAAYGLWTISAWGWTLTVVLMVVGLVQNLLQYLNDNSLLVPMVVSALFAAAILWYLFQPSVRAAFGR